MINSTSAFPASGVQFRRHEDWQTYPNRLVGA
jgi:hypothetical protein